MKYYKHTDCNYILGVGTGSGGIEITESEYNLISEIINNKPKDTATHYYMLKADPLEYEAIERPAPEPEDPKQALIDEIIAEVNS